MGTLDAATFEPASGVTAYEQTELLAALDRALTLSRKQERTGATEAEITSKAAIWRATLTHSDVLEQIDCDAFAAAEEDIGTRAHRSHPRGKRQRVGDRAPRRTSETLQGDGHSVPVLRSEERSRSDVG